MMILKHSIALLLALAATGALADDAQIRKVVESKLGGVKVEGIQPGPLGLYEVRFRGPNGMQVVYTDENATHIFLGKIYDTANDRDLTEERTRKLNAINFVALPL